MARLAWFTPWPPDRSGIVAYSAELLPLVARTHAVDVFVYCSPSRQRIERLSSGETPGVNVYCVQDFIWRHARRPYDLVVYQMGNGTAHDYMWAYFPRYPGLVVLHDGQVHQARAKQLLRHGRAEDYARELAFSHPDRPADLADLVVTGFGGSLLYLWPMLGVILRAARLVAVHDPWLRSALIEADPAARVEHVRMGVGPPVGDGRAVRAQLGISPGSVIFGAFGRVTPEKRIGAVLSAFGQMLGYLPTARLLLVGECTEYYDVMEEARAAGVADKVIVTGFVPDEQLGAYIHAVDVCLCLRWPTARETSASWLRALAAGKPTVVTELAQGASLAALDPRSWTVLEGAVSSRPVAVAIDILDEQHSLGLAMRRLAGDAALRAELGREALAFWRRGHTLERMAEDYEAAIGRALATNDPDRRTLPGHLLADGTALARAVVRGFGVSVDILR